MFGSVSVDLVDMTDGSKKVKAVTPFNRSFINWARQNGGKWDGIGKAWYFDERDEGRVREFCTGLYGTDGTPVPVVDVLLEIKSGQSGDLVLFGRPIIIQRGRDEAPGLGDGVVKIEGVLGGGGSAKYPKWSVRSERAVVEVRDVPLSLAKVAVEEGLTDGDISRVEIVERTAGGGLSSAEQAIVDSLKALPPERRAMVIGAVSEDT